MGNFLVLLAVGLVDAANQRPRYPGNPSASLPREHFMQLTIARKVTEEGTLLAHPGAPASPKCYHSLPDKKKRRTTTRWKNPNPKPPRSFLSIPKPSFRNPQPIAIFALTPPSNIAGEI